MTARVLRRNEEKMRALFVTTDNFPECGACSSLLVNLLNTDVMKQKVSKLDVLSMLYSQKDSSVETVNGITVYRAKSTAFIPMEELNRNKIKYPLDYIGGIVKKIYRKKVHHEDPTRVFWKRSVESCLYRKLVKMKAGQQYDVIVAIAGSYETIAAVMAYQQKYGCHFVFYQVDPCGSNTMYSKSTKITRQRFEEKVYQVADGIVTTPILYQEKLDIYPEKVLNKVCQMEFPNVVPENYRHQPGESNERIRCVFAGRVYRGIRNPSYTCALFGALPPDIELHLVGVTEEELRFFLREKTIPSNIFCYGVCSLKETQQRIAQADILVNIGNEMKNQVPSKLFEYISAGKPILNLYVNPECPTLPYLQRHPFAFSVPARMVGRPEIIEATENFLRKNKGKVIGEEEIYQLYKECTAAYCGNQMADMLEKAIGNGAEYAGEKSYTSD